MLDRGGMGSENYSRRRSALRLSTGLASGDPARLAAGPAGSGSAGETLDGGRIVRRNDRCHRSSGLIGHGAQTQDERDQGEHVSLEFWIAAMQRMPARWRRETVAANAIGSIVIAGIERGPQHSTLKQDA